MNSLHDFCLALEDALRDAPAISRNPLHMVEAELTLSELTSLLAEHKDSNHALSREALQPFRDFLEKRWKRIQSTDACYPHRPDDPLNQTCLWLARELAKFTLPEHGSHELLMPGIDASSFTDNDLHQQPLHHFILSDDNRSWISVTDCLLYAETDGLLKHTSCMDEFKNPKALSAAEQERLLQHTREGRRYYQAIMDLIHLRQNLRNGALGPQVQALVDGLFNGSIAGKGPGQGQEHNSGEPANVATVKFAEFLAQLDPRTKNHLFALRAPGISDSFKDLWDRLSHPTSVKLTDRYCVYLIQSSLKAIHNANREWLHGESIKTLEAIVEKERLAFEKALAGQPLSPVQSSYEDHGQTLLLKRLSLSPALPSICKNLFPACRKRWEDPKKAQENLLEQLEFLALLKTSARDGSADFPGSHPGLSAQILSDWEDFPDDHKHSPDDLIDSRRDLFAQIIGSWEDVLNSGGSDAEKGKLLYYLLREPALEAVVKEQLSTPEKRERLGAQLHAYAETIQNRDPQKAGTCFKMGADLGNPSSIWKLALYYYEKKPPALANALMGFQKSYPLQKTEKERAETLRYLAAIARQSDDPRASVDATVALAGIYQTLRWCGPQHTTPVFTPLPSLTVLIEKIEFLGLLIKNQTALPDEIQASRQIELLVGCINQSWELLLQSALPPERKGELLHYLLTEPLLAKTVRARIQRHDLGPRIGGYLNTFGKTLTAPHLEKALACFEQGADLGCRDCRRNLALYQHRHQELRNWKNAVLEYERSYALWDKEKDRQDILARLMEIGKQTTDVDASQAAVRALARIYSRRWPFPTQPSDPQAFAHLSEKIDFLNLLDKPEYTVIREALIERILDPASLEAVLTPGLKAEEKSSPECGKLLYRLLKHPRLHQPLQERLLAKKSPEMPAGRHLSTFGLSLTKTQPTVALECLTLGAKLESSYSMWHLACALQQAGNTQNLTEAVNWHAKSYSLWSTEKDRRQIIHRLWAISSQKTDPSAACAALTALISILRTRCSSPSTGALLLLIDKIQLLAALKKYAKAHPEATPVPGEQEKLLEDIQVSWPNLLTSTCPESEKGEWLFFLFTQALPVDTQSPALQDKNIRTAVVKSLKAFTSTSIGSNLKAEANTISATLGDPLCAYRLAFYHHKQETPPDLSKAVTWYEKSYSLYTSEEDHQDILKDLKQIARQTTAPRDSRAAFGVLEGIYSTRWKSPRAVNLPFFTVLSEKIDLLNLHLLHSQAFEEKDAEPRERLTQDILDTWDEIMDPELTFSEPRKGELLHRLLMQPLFSDTLYLQLREKNLEAKAGQFLHKYGDSLASRTQTAFEVFQIGAKLGNSDSMLRLGLTFLQQTPPLLTEAAEWLEKCHALLDEEPGRKKFFAHLTHAAKQATDPSVSRTLRTVLEKTFALEDKRTASQPEPHFVFSAKLDYLSLLTTAAPAEKQERQVAALSQQLLASWEQQALHSSLASPRKGEILRRLLAQPLLQKKIRLHIREHQLTTQVSRHLNNFAGSFDVFDPTRTEIYQLGASLGDPLSMKNLGLNLCERTPRNISEGIPWFEESYFLWETNRDRERILDLLRILTKNYGNARENKQAEDALNKIYFQNCRLVKTWKKAIALLPSLPRGEFRNLHKIILDDGREKWVPADIAFQWKHLSQLEKNKPHADPVYDREFIKAILRDTQALASLQKEIHGKTCTNSAVQDYYRLFQSGRLDSLEQEAARKQLKYLASPESWKDQTDGIVRILEQSSKEGDGESKESFTAMLHWTEQFATPAVFLKLHENCRQQLLHFISAQVGRGQPLALALEERLLAIWNDRQNAFSRAALIQYYQAKQVFFKPPSEARASIDQILASLELEVYRASWQGQLTQLKNNIHQFFTLERSHRQNTDRWHPPEIRAAIGKGVLPRKIAPPIS